MNSKDRIAELEAELERVKLEKAHLEGQMEELRRQLAERNYQPLFPNIPQQPIQIQPTWPNTKPDIICQVTPDSYTYMSDGVNLINNQQFVDAGIA